MWLVFVLIEHAGASPCSAATTVVEVREALDTFAGAVRSQQPEIVEAQADQALHRLGCLQEIAAPSIVADVYRAQAIASFVASGGTVDQEVKEWLCGLAPVDAASPWPSSFGPDHPLRVPVACGAVAHRTFPEGVGLVYLNGTPSAGFDDRTPYLVQTKNGGVITTHLIDGVHRTVLELKPARTAPLKAADGDAPGGVKPGKVIGAISTVALVGVAGGLFGLSWRDRVAVREGLQGGTLDIDAAQGDADRSNRLLVAGYAVAGLGVAAGLTTALAGNHPDGDRVVAMSVGWGFRW